MRRRKAFSNVQLVEAKPCARSLVMYVYSFGRGNNSGCWEMNNVSVATVGF